MNTKWPRRRARRRNPGLSYEAEIQKQAEAYLDAVRLVYFRIPDTLLGWFFGYMKASVPPWALKFVSKYLKGWPDLIVFKGDRFLAIELKRADGKTTAKQREKIKALGAHVCRSFDEFQNLVDEWRTKAQ